MPPNPHVSYRKSITWAGETSPEAENAHTIVLTSAYKRYVDVRVYRTLPNELTPFLPIDKPGEDSSARLEWGFAGFSSSQPAKCAVDGTVLTPGHGTWTHWIDSKTLLPLDDEGFMYPIHGTDLTTEKGVMAHPKTGENTEYEEVWQDLEILKCGKDEVFVSWVATLDHPHPASTRRGVLCRIGQWIQGVLRVSATDFRVMRWKWNEDGETWLQELGIGQFHLDLKLLSSPSIPMRIGMEFESGFEQPWSIVEVHYWPNGLTEEKPQLTEEAKAKLELGQS